MSPQPKDREKFTAPNPALAASPVPERCPGWDAARLRDWMAAELGRLNQVAASEIDLAVPFSENGVDSASATALALAISQLLGMKLSPTLLWRYPTPEALIGYLAERDSASVTESPASARPGGREPIAVIGMACRFPGASDPAMFWQLLCDGVDATSEVPPDRWDPSLLDQARGALGPAVRRAGFLSAVAGFDPQFFGISPREAVEMDPQQRLMLELAWEALESAGLLPKELRSTPTGVFIGAIWRDYAEIADSALTRVTSHTATGQALNMIANRVSHFFGLQGPSLVVDTACSSSLVAVHLGCSSLWSGESSIALVGGVNLLLSPHTMMALSQFGGLSPDGRCKAFDASADGFGRGEGGAVMVLKPLAAAIADGDPILGLIRATAVNNDGPSNGLTAPNPEAQERLLREVYSRAEVELATVGYIEAHGTGTALGDPIEAGALGAVFSSSHPAEQPLLIGSVKTNIGHLEGAAGIAGLAKALLCVRHRYIVPSLHFTKANPHIPFSALGLAVADTGRPWPFADRPAIAGVSSFGWGGTNVHVVLEEYSAPPPLLVTLSAPDQAALVEVARRAAQDLGSPSPPSELAWTDEHAASRDDVRLAAVVRSPQAARELLSQFLGGAQVPGLQLAARPQTRPRQAFVCSPQGGQWPGMMRLLLATEPAFRRALTDVDRALAPLLGWSVREQLLRPEGIANLDDVEVAQPLLFACQVALAEQWRSWGVQVDAVIGHSVGEIAAAHIAGILDLEEATHVVYHYSQQQRRLANRGVMAVIELAPAALRTLLNDRRSSLSIAAHNGSRSTVVSGEPAELDGMLAELKEKHVKCARVRVNVAAHGPQVDLIAADLSAALAGIRGKAARIPMISTTSCCRLAGPDVDGRYFVRNLRQTVLFEPVLNMLACDGFEVFIELSPQPVLAPAIQNTLEASHLRGRVFGSANKSIDERLALYESRAALFCLGIPERCSARAELITLSAHTPEVLRKLATATALSIKESPAVSVQSLAWTTAMRRTHHARRAAVVARTTAQAAAALTVFAQAEPAAQTPRRESRSKKPGVVFVFSGQGAQYVGMGRELLAEPAFSHAVTACDAVIGELTGMSVLTELLRPEETSQLARIDVVQPLLFTIAVALAAQWRAWGIEPDAVIGHSMGELAAAHIAGVLSLEHAAQVICTRSRLLLRASGKGAMLLAELPMPDAQRLIAGREALVAVAVSNSSRSTVLSGDPAVLRELAEELGQRGCFWRWVKVDVASHSPQMDVLRDDLLKAVHDVHPQPAQRAMFSTVLGTAVRGPELDAHYWVRNLREPVLFAAAVRQASASGLTIFVEMSPHPILLPAVEQELAELDRPGLVLGSLRRGEPDRESMLNSLGALYQHGLNPCWPAVTPRGHHIALPPYPWPRERFWIAPSAGAAAAVTTGCQSLLGMHLHSAVDATVHHWLADWRYDLCEALQDHLLGGESIVPGSAFLAMATAAGQVVLGTSSAALRNIVFVQPLVVKSAAPPRLQTVVTGSAGRREVRIFAAQEKGWVLHAQAELEEEASPSQAALHGALKAARAFLIHSATKTLGQQEFYDLLATAGLQLGPAFRQVERAWTDGQKMLASILVPALLPGEADSYVRYLDAALQPLVACLLTLPHKWVPGFINQGMERFEPCARPSAPFFCLVQLREPRGSSLPIVDMIAESADGRLLFSAIGVNLQRFADGPLAGGEATSKFSAQLSETALAEIAAAGPDQRQQRVGRQVKDLVAQVLKLSADRIAGDVPLRSLGMDSVMSLELRNRIEAHLRIRISATALWNYPTVEELATFVAGKLAAMPGFTTDSAVSVPPLPSYEPDGSPSHLMLPAALTSEQSLADELMRVQQLINEVQL